MSIITNNVSSFYRSSYAPTSFINPITVVALSALFSYARGANPNADLVQCINSCKENSDHPFWCILACTLQHFISKD